MGIKENFNEIQQGVNTAAERSGRVASDIKIISVSKTFPAHDVQEAIDCGIAIFGENKVQEAKGKIPQLNGNFEFHLIGHLQSNKAKDAVRLFSIIHSIDKLSTASACSDEAKKIGKCQKILLQVNTSAEETKSGTEPENAIATAKEILRLDGVKLIGLMTIGPLCNDENRIRESFRTLKHLLSDMNSSLGTQMKELSMGMSSDYSIAVEEGSTMIRVGSAIFGKRDYNA